MGPVNSIWDPLEKHEMLFSKKKKKKWNAYATFIIRIQTYLSSASKKVLSMRWLQIKKPTYFTFQLIFNIIHESYCTILTNFYIYISIILLTKKFQFQHNKQIPNRP